VLTEAGRRYFTLGQDYYIGNYIYYMAHLLNECIPRFTEVVKTGQPVLRPEKKPEIFAALVEVLFSVNYEPAQQLADHLLSSTSTLVTVLDVGAGSAPWSIALAQKNAQLQIDAFELPPVLNITRAFTQRYGVQNQYQFLSGDVLAPDHWGLCTYDLIYLGHVCCIFSETENQELLRRCARSLNPGGSLVLIEFLPKPDRTGPLLDVLFACLMLSTNDCGDAYPRESYEEWCQMAGLEDLEWIEIPAASTPVLVARKSAGQSSLGVSSLNREFSLSLKQEQAPSLPFVLPTQIIETTFAFAQSCMLLTAVELQIFTRIARGAHTLEQIAERARVAQPALERLLGGLLAMGFLQRAGQHYDLTPVSAIYLVSDHPTYIGDIVLQIRQEWNAWINLTDVVRTGQAVRHINEEPLGGKFFASLVEHLFPLLYPIMQRIFKRLELGTQIQGAKVLDLGAGSAPGAIAALELDQKGFAVLVDFVLVLERAKIYAREHGVYDRAAFWPMDLAVLDLPADYFDIAIASHLFRILGPDLTQRLIRQSYRALKTNGRLIIIETYEEPERYWKLFPQIVSIDMLVNTRYGDTFTLQQMCQWLQDTGFQVEVWFGIGPDPVVIATHVEV
jgi:ubiquinone/menaquinone biosynthesis C-methylase UbiE